MKKLLIAAVLMTSALMVGSIATADAATVTVTEADVTRQAENTPPTDQWVIYTRNAGTATFRVGPATPPLGVGSLELVTPTSLDKVQAFNYDHVGTKLTDIDAISYWTYRTAGAGQQVAAINIEVDVNGTNVPGGFTTLVFEPVYNTDQGPVVSNAWQFWDAFNSGDAIWWSSNPIPSAPNRDTFVSWDTIVAANPDAVIVGGFGVNQGSGNPGLTSSVDALSIGANGTTTYDFEPLVGPPSSKSQCKKGGWRTFNAPGPFKNQGDCVSYVATGGKNKPSG